MEKVVVSNRTISLDDAVIDLDRITGIIGTCDGVALIMRDGSSVLVDMDPADLFTLSDHCPWAVCSV